MPRGEQVSRIYQILMDLVRNPRGIPATVLAQRRGLRLRTVYRDIEALRRAGFPIERGSQGRWRLADHWQAQLPFPLPAEEILALQTAREFLKPLRGTPVERAFAQLCSRLLGPNGSQGELFPYYRTILQTRSTFAIDYRPHLSKLETLCTAIQERRSVRTVYWGLNRSQPTLREIDPYRLYFDPSLEALYLFGWCHLRKAIRVFAVHRFESVRMTERQFSPPQFDVKDFLRDAFRLWREANVQQVRFRVYPPLARWVAERQMHASQEIRRLQDNAIEVSLTVEASEEIKRFLLQLGAYAEVLAPESLRASVANELQRALRHYLPAPIESLSPGDKVALPPRGSGLKKSPVRAGVRRQRQAR
ncbi:MAG: WYL domain-containing protein [Candidatus Binatia bacterium]|nr:MAG: WYL domain-containing protein [Candidatus Binatia bacterium]